MPRLIGDRAGAWTAGERTLLGVFARGLERFGERDLELGASIGLPWGQRWTIGAEASGSPTHRVAPIWSGGR